MRQRAVSGHAERSAVGAAPLAANGWVSVAPARRGPSKAHLSWRPVLVQLGLTALLVIGLVTVAGVVEARETAERDAVDHATDTTGLLVRNTVQPAISDDLLGTIGDTSTAAFGHLDDVVHRQVLTDTIVRVKLWTRDGRIIYSDEPRLISETYPLDPIEIAAMKADTSVAGVSNLAEPENRYEQQAGKLIEVYYPVWTQSGVELLFETYLKYDRVIALSQQRLVTLASIAIGALLLILSVQMPISWLMIGRLRSGERQRQELLAKALSASAEERRRIAGTLHDAVVQDLAAVSFVVAGSADQARDAGESQLGDQLDLASTTLRANIRRLRTLLVEIYPPNLRSAGLAHALKDLIATLPTSGTAIAMAIEPNLRIGERAEALIYGVAQECLRNAASHARASAIQVEIARVGDVIRLEVSDDGVGLDPRGVLADATGDHFGLRVIRDLAADYGASLVVRTSPGSGTRWRLEVPSDGE